MNPKLKTAVNEFLAMRMSNPDPVDVSTRFQQFLVANRLQHEFDQNEMAEAFSKIGVPDDEIADAMEELTSWL